MSTDAKAFGSQAAVRAAIGLSSEFDVANVTMNVLATVVACYGLFENSPAVVIGAMIIAMLLGPISGVALGLVDGNDPLFKKALATFGGWRCAGLLNGVCSGCSSARISVDW